MAKLCTFCEKSYDEGLNQCYGNCGNDRIIIELLLRTKNHGGITSFLESR